MSKLLDHIFIETSVLQQESFFKDTSCVTKLLNLAEQGYICILLPVITEKEWLKHFKENSTIQNTQNLAIWSFRES